MKYFFVLGSNPTLSIAEIAAVFDLEKSPIIFLSREILIIEIEEKIDSQKLIRRLGGTIKLGQAGTEMKNINTQTIVKEAKRFFPNDPGGKIKFGFSYYGKRNLNLKTVGMETKKYLKEQGLSCRWVVSKEKVLSSVVIGQNRLLESGAEIVLIEDGNRLWLGKTEAIQPFKEFSARDYGRPARDDHSGMLPPKLAIMMINLAVKGENPSGKCIMDPFCGSGTVLQEAALMGFSSLLGADISEKAVSDTKKNLEWVAGKSQITIPRLRIEKISAAELGKKNQENSVDYIVTEPYLGPQRGRIDFEKTITELNGLYSKAIREFAKVLKASGRVSMVWPLFAKASRSKPRPGGDFRSKEIATAGIFLNPEISGFRMAELFSGNLRNNKIIELTKRNTIIYGRSGQKVWREIVVLEKL